MARKYDLLCVILQSGIDVFDDIWQEFEGLSHLILSKYFGLSKNNVWYDDLVSESMIVVHKCAMLYDSKSGYQFTTYAARSVRNRVIDCLKKWKGRTVSITREGIEISFEEFVDTLASESWSYENADNSIQLQEFVASIENVLNGDEKDLFYFMKNGFDFDMIADVFEWPISRVKESVLFLEIKIRTFIEQSELTPAGDMI